MKNFFNFFKNNVKDTEKEKETVQEQSISSSDMSLSEDLDVYISSDDENMPKLEYPSLPSSPSHKFNVFNKIDDDFEENYKTSIEETDAPEIQQEDYDTDDEENYRSIMASSVVLSAIIAGGFVSLIISLKHVWELMMYDEYEYDYNRVCH